MLMKPEDVARRINAGATLFLAGDEALLAALPRGNWIGGSSPYFMDSNGGKHSRDLIFVQEQSNAVSATQIRWYAADALAGIAADSPGNGYSLVIIPATSPAHVRYAEDAPGYSGLFMKNIVGWIAGVDLNDLGKVLPRVFDGTTGESSSQAAVVLHATLPHNKLASVGIVNCMEQGDGDRLQFDHDGFIVEQCLVNGEPRNFAEYLVQTQADTRLPLVADYNGEMINVSFQSVEADHGKVTLYAPVFRGVEYRMARPIDNYVARFMSQIPTQLTQPEFCCNCILNYLYSELEGKKTGTLTGPVTFGEIAYQLVNQTLVYLTISDI